VGSEPKFLKPPKTGSFPFYSPFFSFSFVTHFHYILKIPDFVMTGTSKAINISAQAEQKQCCGFKTICYGSGCRADFFDDFWIQILLDYQKNSGPGFNPKY
jgi:hypothetical protein